MAGQIPQDRRRFVILQHDHPFLHWDLLLERGESAATWRLLNLPTVGLAIPAERIGDHRLHYLDIEGAVSGDRGTVIRIASGAYSGEIPDYANFEIQLFETPLATRARMEIESSKQCAWQLYD